MSSSDLYLALKKTFYKLGVHNHPGEHFEKNIRIDDFSRHCRSFCSRNRDDSVSTSSQPDELHGKKADLEISDPAWKFQIGHLTAEYEANAGAKGKGLSIGVGYEFNRLVGVSASFANIKNEYAVSEYAYYSDSYYDYKYSENSNLYTGAVEFTPMRYDYKDLAFRAALMLGVVSLKDTGPFYGAAMTLSLNKQIGISLDTKVRIKTANSNSPLDSLNQISLVGYY